MLMFFIAFVIIEEVRVWVIYNYWLFLSKGGFIKVWKGWYLCLRVGRFYIDLYCKVKLLV